MPEGRTTAEAWHKSSLSGEGNCVEVRRHADGVVDVRDAKEPDGPVLSFSAQEWDAFTRGVVAGEF